MHYVGCVLAGILVSVVSFLVLAIFFSLILDGMKDNCKELYEKKKQFSNYSSIGSILFSSCLGICIAVWMW